MSRRERIKEIEAERGERRGEIERHRARDKDRNSQKERGKNSKGEKKREGERKEREKEEKRKEERRKEKKREKHWREHKFANIDAPRDSRVSCSCCRTVRGSDCRLAARAAARGINCRSCGRKKRITHESV